MSSAKLYLKPISAKAPTIIPNSSPVTIGRSESCDITINHDYLSYVHASVSLNNDGQLAIQDLDSTNGVYLNGDSNKSFVAKLGDKVHFAGVEYLVEVIDENAKQTFDQQQTKSILKRADIIRRLVGKMPPLPGEQSPAELQESILEIFPEFEFTEFIFEENVGGKAFQHDSNSSAVEVTILFGNYIYSVEYFTADEKELSISADSFGNEDTVYLPLIELLQDKTLVSSEDDRYFVHNVFDSVNVFKDGYVEKGLFELDGKKRELLEGELIIAKIDQATLYFKITKAPPKILGYNRLLSDKLMASLMLIFVLLWMGASSFLSSIEITEKPIEKIVVDRILYVSNTTTTLAPPPPPPTTTLLPVSTEESVSSEDSVKQEVQKEESSEKSSEVANVDKEKKESGQKQVVEVSKAQSQKEETKTPDKVVEEVKVSETAKVKKSFKSKISALKNKYSKYTKKNKSNLSSKSDSKSLLLNSSFDSNKSNKATTLVKAKQRGTNLTGKNIGALGKSHKINSTGLSNKISRIGNILGGRTVVLGSLDPNDIKRLLKEHTPRFSYCYEKELERRGIKKKAIIVTEFMIYTGGVVRDISVSSNRFKLSARAIKCFKTVLTRIPFPSPKGGGKVGVKQPFIMEPR